MCNTEQAQYLVQRKVLVASKGVHEHSFGFGFKLKLNLDDKR